MRHIVFQVIVAAHELIGHGCGKILAEVAHGEYNFDIDHLPVNPLTAKPVDSWYKLGETPKSLFGKLLSSYTECLAESIALYVIAEASLLEILDATSSSVTVDDSKSRLLFSGKLVSNLTPTEKSVLYNGYLQTIWMGLRGLLSYDPDSKVCGIYFINPTPFIVCFHESRRRWKKTITKLTIVQLALESSSWPGKCSFPLCFLLLT